MKDQHNVDQSRQYVYVAKSCNTNPAKNQDRMHERAETLSIKQSNDTLENFPTRHLVIKFTISLSNPENKEIEKLHNVIKIPTF